MIKKNTIYITLFLCWCSFTFFSQTNTNNSINSLKVWRTTNNINEVIVIPVTNFSVEKNSKKFINIMVNYNTQPDIAISTISGENLNHIIRPLKTYSELGKWQTLVFQINGGTNGINVNTLYIFPDIGIKNILGKQVLNDSGSYGYIDEITLSETSTLSNKKITIDKVEIYPNPSSDYFIINSNKKTFKLQIFNSLGKNIRENHYKVDDNKYDISKLSSGLYFVKIIDQAGAFTIKKMIVKK